MSAQKIGDAFVSISVKGAAFAAKQIEDLKKSAEKQQKQDGFKANLLTGFALGGGAAAALLSIKGLTIAIGQMGKAINKVQSELIGAIVRLSDIQKIADRLGASSSWISVMRLMVRDSNMTMAEFEQSIAAFQRNMETFSQGVGESKQTFENLGISPNDLKSWVTLEDKMLNIIDRLALIGDESQRSGASMRIFGEQGRKLIPLVSANRELYNILKAQAEFLGLDHSEEGIRSADELRDSFVKMRIQVDALWERFAIALAPAISDLLSMVIVGTKLLSEFSAIIGYTAGASGDTGKALSVLGEALLFLSTYSVQYATNTLAGLLEMLHQITEALEFATSAVYLFNVATLNIPSAISSLQAGKELDKISDSLGKLSARSFAFGQGFAGEARDAWKEWQRLLDAESAAMKNRMSSVDAMNEAITNYSEVFNGDALNRSASTMQRIAELQSNRLVDIKREIVGLRGDVTRITKVGKI